MANKLRAAVKDDAELQKEMSMSSLKRALDDVEYNGCVLEPVKKKTRLPIPKRHMRGRVNGKTKLSGRTHCKILNTKKCFQKAPRKHTLKALSRHAPSESSDPENKTEKSTELVIKKKRSKRSADFFPNHMSEESDIKKRKVEQTVTEIDSNHQDSTKTSNEVSTTEVAVDTSQYTESPKFALRSYGITEYMREGKESYVQQNYTFRKNVAFARKVVVYASDGSEYDYSDVDVGIGDDDDDDDDDDIYDYDDLDDDYDYEDVDPDAEVVSKRLNLQIADFFKLHRNRDPSVLKTMTKIDSQSGKEQPTELRQTSSFGIGLFHKQLINTTYHESVSAGGSGAAPAFEHDENGNDAEEFDRASAASSHLHDVRWW